MIDEFRVGLELGEHLLLLRRHQRAAEGLAHHLPHLRALDIVGAHRVVPKHPERVLAVWVQPDDLVVARVEQRRRRAQQRRLQARERELLVQVEQAGALLRRRFCVELRLVERLGIGHERADANPLQLGHLRLALGIALTQSGLRARHAHG